MYKNQQSFLQNQKVAEKSGTKNTYGVDITRRGMTKILWIAVLGAGVYGSSTWLREYLKNQPEKPNELGQIVIKGVDGKLYAENSGMVFRFYDSEPAKRGDGVMALISREWLRHANDSDIVPVDAGKLNSDRNTINLLEGAKSTYIARIEEQYSKDVKHKNKPFDPQFMTPDPLYVGEGKSYPVPIPTKFKSLKSLEEALMH